MTQQELASTVREAAAASFDALVAIRRHLHRHPELSFKEEQTGRYIAARLAEWDIPHTTGWAGHGVVGLIEGAQPGPTIALRADIDALPIREADDRPYRSEVEGVMHACGHDVHTTCLLGAARILWSLRRHLRGSVKLIFQPGEEKLPGGASIMIREGVLDDPRPAAILGQHVHPPLEVGKVGFREGMYMASADELYLTIEGRGGHGALPQDCVDPVAIAAQMIAALQQVVSRKADPTIPSVLTFGKIWSDGGATNIIPGKVFLEGTFRTMNEEWRAEAHRLIEQICRHTAEMLDGRVELRIVKGYPCLVNDPGLTRRVRAGAVAYLGEENVVELPIRMTAEDFAWYSHHVPACFWRLGTGNAARGITSPVHTPTFDVDERALEVGAGLMAFEALSLNAEA